MVTVRMAVAADAEAIARVHTLSWQAAYRGIVPDSYLDSLRWESRYERWSRDLADASPSPSTTLVACDDAATVIAFATLGPNRDTDQQLLAFYELYAIYVLPSSWGQGAGAALIASALDTIPDGVPGVSLWVLEQNTRGREFYERSGFLLNGAKKTADIGGALLEEVQYVRHLT